MLYHYYVLLSLHVFWQCQYLEKFPKITQQCWGALGQYGEVVSFSSQTETT